MGIPKKDKDRLNAMGPAANLISKKLGTQVDDMVNAVDGTPAFTVGAEAANVINVAVVVKDLNGSAVATKRKVYAWLSATAGAVVVTTAPTGGVAVGTDGTVISSPQANKEVNIITTAAGKFDLNVTDTGTPTFYLNIETQGQVFSSPAITFA